jgi:hypothetical protein
MAYSKAKLKSSDDKVIVHHRKPKMGSPCPIIKSKSMQSSLYDENIKRNNEPIHDMKHLFFKF